MPKTFSISGQHYLFDVQTFAQVVLAAGGDEYHYALYDRTTQGVIDDVVSRTSDLGVICQTTQTAALLDEELDRVGLEFHELARSAPRIALPKSHPMVNLPSIRLDEMEGYPYVYFYQGENAPDHFYEEAFGAVPRDKAIACTDRASLSELIVALNGYTVTSGILVGVTDGTLLTTVPMDTDLELLLGYVTRKGSTLSELEQKFVDRLGSNLQKYAARM